MYQRKKTKSFVEREPLTKFVIRHLIKLIKIDIQTNQVHKISDSDSFDKNLIPIKLTKK